ncbi:MAG TPA: sugar ABC transporter substrate-binding protein [Micromonosporaceae bacterium]|nr:sugar ABC transporter substrate-binding protein [Micromonosporaceae bacterium]
MSRSAFMRSTVIAASAAILAFTTLSACSSSGKPAAASTGSGAANKTLNIAYLSFAVANSYDAPMLAAAQAAAADGNAKLTVFDANNSPQTQFSQFQNVIASGKYDGVIVQPILGTGLTSLVQQAIAKGIKVVNIDQILGPDYTTDQPQVAGLSANVTFVPSKIGTQMGQLTVQACQSKNLNPCNVGFMYDIKASTLDVAIHKAFIDAISGTPSIKVVAEGEDFFTPAGGLKAAQDMLQAHPDLSLIVASDQGLEGTTQALTAAHKSVLMVGYGASAAGIAFVKAGTVFGDVAQAPASEGRLGVVALIKAIRNNTVSGAIDPVAQLPNGGIVTKDNADSFTAEWPG